jgi:hypothetical protein
MDNKFRKLIELGAGDFEHIVPSLIEHLERTRCLLKSWSASDVLQDAGLYYAAYDINDTLCDVSLRSSVANIIGAEVESVIYRYFSCNHPVVFAQFESEDTPRFCNRLTHKTEIIDQESIRQLCELTAAINIDKAMYQANFKVQQGEALPDMFRRMERFLSAAAMRNINHNFLNDVENSKH